MNEKTTVLTISRVFVALNEIFSMASYKDSKNAASHSISMKGKKSYLANFRMTMTLILKRHLKSLNKTHVVRILMSI